MQTLLLFQTTVELLHAVRVDLAVERLGEQILRFGSNVPLATDARVHWEHHLALPHSGRTTVLERSENLRFFLGWHLSLRLGLPEHAHIGVDA